MIGRATAVPPRGEDGKRDVAELLHAQLNTILRCPNCNYQDSNRGVFNKDVAGKADIDGRRYRRFVCRSNLHCGKSMSVTDFIGLCDHLRPTNSHRYEHASIKSTERPPSTSFNICQPHRTRDHNPIVTEYTHISPTSMNQSRDIEESLLCSNTSTPPPLNSRNSNTSGSLYSSIQQMQDDIKELRADLQKERMARQSLETTVITLSETLSSLVTLEEKSTKLTASQRNQNSPQGACSSSVDTVDDLPPLSLLPNNNNTHKSVPSPPAQLPNIISPSMEPDKDEHVNNSATKRTSKRPSYASVTSRGHHYSKISSGRQSELSSENNHDGHTDISSEVDVDSDSPLARPKLQRKTTSTPIYVRGIPYLPIGDVKRLLARKPVNLQIRYIYNMSWIDHRILEILVDGNHLQQMKNRISKDTTYSVRTSFDPLSRTSFQWKSDITPEMQESILKDDFVKRIASSIATMKADTTRRYLQQWAHNRGVGTQLDRALLKQYKLAIPQNPFPSEIPSSMDLSTKTSLLKTRPEIPVTSNAKVFASRKRPYTTTDSMEKYVDKPNLYLL
ncbi:hypothetical protein HOY82DRAFT_544386 [Tuber indicum]|nr:hypothetical protein HOY82DRAFT_544386 [Tuber indicum]